MSLYLCICITMMHAMMLIAHAQHTLFTTHYQRFIQWFEFADTYHKAVNQIKQLIRGSILFKKQEPRKINYSHMIISLGGES